MTIVDRCVAVEDLGIDLDADPFVPTRWRLKSHQKGGLWHFDPRQVALYCFELFGGSSSINGDLVYSGVQVLPVFNANLLRFYYDHNRYIPESWKTAEQIVFAGTLYENYTENNPDGGVLCWRTLFWCQASTSWRWSWMWISEKFTPKTPFVSRLLL